jgi:aspartate carbamoyltransferase catalytic subunit
MHCFQRLSHRITFCLLLIFHQVGACARAAKCLTIPLINAGDGMGEHPTQALLDLYTIQKECGGIENKVVTMLGDPSISAT